MHATRVISGGALRTGLANGNRIQRGHHPELVGCGCSNSGDTAPEVGGGGVENHFGRNAGFVGTPGRHRRVCGGPVILDS